MKSAIIATIIGSAAAFAPAPVAKTTSAVNAFEGKFIALFFVYHCFIYFNVYIIAMLYVIISYNFILTYLYHYILSQ